MQNWDVIAEESIWLSLKMESSVVWRFLVIVNIGSRFGSLLG